MSATSPVDPHPLVARFDELLKLEPDWKLKQTDAAKITLREFASQPKTYYERLDRVMGNLSLFRGSSSRSWGEHWHILLLRDKSLLLVEPHNRSTSCEYLKPKVGRKAYTISSFENPPIPQEYLTQKCAQFALSHGMEARLNRLVSNLEHPGAFLVNQYINDFFLPHKPLHAQSRLHLLGPYHPKGNLAEVMHLYSRQLKSEEVDRWDALLLDNYDSLATAISVLHSQALYHGDLKGENLLVTSELGIKLIDFGSSDNLPERGFSWRGNAAYQPPMIFLHSYAVDSFYPGKEAARRQEGRLKVGRISACRGDIVDLYALGLLFYLMAVKQEPFWLQRVLGDEVNESNWEESKRAFLSGFDAWHLQCKWHENPLICEIIAPLTCDRCCTPNCCKPITASQLTERVRKLKAAHLAGSYQLPRSNEFPGLLA